MKLLKRKLSNRGFLRVAATALVEHWPDMPLPEAEARIEASIEVPIGAKGYGWSVSAARKLALIYVTNVPRKGWEWR